MTQDAALLVRETVARLDLNDTQAADYFGVSVHTIRKWRTGQRQPGAAVAQLVKVLGVIEALTPAIHDSFIKGDRCEKF